MCAAGKTILVVDDEEAIREMLSFALQFEGLNVYTAANGQEALEVLPSIERPCLVLLDLMMPTMNGWEFAAALEKSTAFSDLPVVLVTAYADRIESIHAKAIIPKPVQLSQLMTLVNQYCV